MKLTTLFKSAIIGSIVIASVNANAQMVSPNVFIQGSYVEVGVTTNGDYGTSVAPPAGYHAHGSAGLGFVCDYGKDGWTAGTPPFMGDYFLPGSPFEGWELQVDTGRCQAFNNGTGLYVGSFAGSGGNISYTTSGSTKSGTWQGTVDSITITQVTTIDTLNLYFTINITLTNTSITPKNNIYYLRSLDPDNDESWPGGSFFTYNKIEHQVTDTTVVSATGYTGAFSMMALGTTDTPATAFIYSAWPLPVSVDLATVFNQTYTPADYTQGTNDDGDLGIGVVLKVAHLATVDSAIDSVARTTATHRKHPANSESFTFFYAFGAAAADSAISHTLKAKAADTVVTPPASTGSLAVKNVNAAGEVKVYPNPSKNIINITGLNSGDHISLYDVMGKTVDQDWSVSGSSVNTFSMGNIAAGAYILVVNDANGTMKAKVPVRKL